MMFDSHGDFVYGRLPTDRPHVVKVYGSYLFKFGTNLGLNFYGGSGTPISQIDPDHLRRTRCSSRAAAISDGRMR